MTDAREVIRLLLQEFGEQHYSGCPADYIPARGPCNCFAGALCDSARLFLGTPYRIFRGEE